MRYVNLHLCRKASPLQASVKTQLNGIVQGLTLFLLVEVLGPVFLIIAVDVDEVVRFLRLCLLLLLPDLRIRVGPLPSKGLTTESAFCGYQPGLGAAYHETGEDDVILQNVGSVLSLVVS